MATSFTASTLPSSIRAARVASTRLIPARIFLFDVHLEERSQFRVQLFFRAAFSKKGVEAVYDSPEERQGAPHEFTIRLAARPAGRRGSHGGRACTKQASPPGRISLIPR